MSQTEEEKEVMVRDQNTAMISNFEVEELEDRFEMEGWVRLVINAVCQPK